MSTTTPNFKKNTKLEWNDNAEHHFQQIITQVARQQTTHSNLTGKSESKMTRFVLNWGQLKKGNNLRVGTQ